MDCVTVESGCNDELTNKGFAFQQEECHAHRDKLQLQLQHRSSRQRQVELIDKRTHCSVKVQVLLCRHRQISKESKWRQWPDALPCISAIMKFGAGADDDPFVKAKVQRTSASQKQTSCLNLTMRLDRIGAAVLISSPMTTKLFTTMQ